MSSSSRAAPERAHLLALLLLAAVAPPALANGAGIECNVPADAHQAQYIVGYGSLMQDASRERTSPHAGAAHPVEIAGFRRGWFARGTSVGFSTTFLGVLPDRNSRLNAVIYRVDAAELAATDGRERSYCRTGVAPGNVKPLEHDVTSAPAGQIWIYVSRPDGVARPDAKYPIVQSYVDVFLTGCLEQQERFGLAGFAAQCIATTADWSTHWVNDRIYPRRPFVFQPRAGQIDRLLSTQLPNYFARIRIEGGG
jgi:hypothetical protein